MWAPAAECTANSVVGTYKLHEKCYGMYPPTLDFLVANLAKVWEKLQPKHTLCLQQHLGAPARKLAWGRWIVAPPWAGCTPHDLPRLTAHVPSIKHAQYMHKPLKKFDSQRCPEISYLIPCLTQKCTSAWIP